MFLSPNISTTNGRRISLLDYFDPSFQEESFELSPDSVASKMRLRPEMAQICSKLALSPAGIAWKSENTSYSHFVPFCISSMNFLVTGCSRGAINTSPDTTILRKFPRTLYLDLNAHKSNKKILIEGNPPFPLYCVYPLY